MSEEFKINGVRFWKECFDDLKPNDLIDSDEYFERYNLLKKLLLSDKAFLQGRKYFSFGDSRQVELRKNFKGKFRYLILPYTIIDKFIVKWDPEINKNLSLETLRFIWKNPSWYKTLPKGEYTSLPPLAKLSTYNTFRDYGIARPLEYICNPSVDKRYIWDSRYSHRMNLCAATKTDIPIFVDSRASTLHGSGKFNIKNLKVDIHIEKDKLRYCHNNFEFGYTKFSSSLIN